MGELEVENELNPKAEHPAPVPVSADATGAGFPADDQLSLPS